MSLIATTITGLEKASAKEVGGKFYLPGRVIFDNYNNESFLTVDLIYELITSFKFTQLSNLLDKIKSININLVGSYNCLCKRIGEHDFTSTIIEQDVGRIIGLKSENASYSKEMPNTTILIDIIDDSCSIGILKKKDISRREYRFKLHNQTTPQLLASCLIKHLGIKSEESLLVIECKDGIIPIEASLQNITKITGHDLNQNNIRNAKINAKLAKKEIRFTSTPIKSIVEKQDYIVTQFIFSKYKKGPYGLIHDVFELSEKVLEKKLAIITNHPKDMETFRSNALKLRETLKVKNKKADLTILIYSKD